MRPLDAHGSTARYSWRKTSFWPVCRKAREAYENAEEEEVDDDEFLRSYDRTRRHAVELAAQGEHVLLQRAS